MSHLKSGETCMHDPRRRQKPGTAKGIIELFFRVYDRERLLHMFLLFIRIKTYMGCERRFLKYKTPAIRTYLISEIHNALEESMGIKVWSSFAMIILHTSLSVDFYLLDMSSHFREIGMGLMIGRHIQNLHT